MIGGTYTPSAPKQTKVDLYYGNTNNGSHSPAGSFLNNSKKSSFLNKNPTNSFLQRDGGDLGPPVVENIDDRYLSITQFAISVEVGLDLIMLR